MDKLYSLAKVTNSHCDLSQLESRLFISVQCPWDELALILSWLQPHNSSVVFTNQCTGVHRGTVKALCWYPSDKPIKSALITGPSSSAANALEYCQEDQLLWLRKINAFLSLPEAIIWWQRSSTLVFIFPLMTPAEQILTKLHTHAIQRWEGRKERLSNFLEGFSVAYEIWLHWFLSVWSSPSLSLFMLYTLHVPSLLH